MQRRPRLFPEREPRHARRDSPCSRGDLALRRSPTNDALRLRSKFTGKLNERRGLPRGVGPFRRASDDSWFGFQAPLENRHRSLSRSSSSSFALVSRESAKTPRAFEHSPFSCELVRGFSVRWSRSKEREYSRSRSSRRRAFAWQSGETVFGSRHRLHR